MTSEGKQNFLHQKQKKTIAPPFFKMF